MEKGPKPFSEEKAKEIMEAEGLKERSQVEQDAFEAGQKHELRGGADTLSHKEEGKKLEELGFSTEIIEKVIEFKKMIRSKGITEGDEVSITFDFPVFRERFGDGPTNHALCTYLGIEKDGRVALNHHSLGGGGMRYFGLSGVIDIRKIHR